MDPRIEDQRRSNVIKLFAGAAFLLAAAALVVVGSGLFRDRTAVAVPTPQPTEPGAATPTVGVPTTAGVVPTATSALPTAATPAPPSGHLLVRTEPAETEPVPTTFGLIDLANGTYRSLGVAVTAALSADGRRVHLVREDATCRPTLVTVDLVGKELERIKGSFAPGDGSFAWSPDDRHVVFSRYVNGQPKRMCGSQGGEYEAAQLVSATIVINAASGWKVGAPLIAASPPPRYRWSPDGSSILIADDSPRFLVVDPATKHTIDLSPKLTEVGALYFGARWAPDGRSILYVYAPPTGSPLELEMIVLAGSTLRTVGPAGDAGEPVWAPDGRSVAVVRGLNDGILTLLDPDGVRPEISLRQLAIDGFAPFGWSPDGGWLACTGNDGTLALVATIGSEVRTVLRPVAGSLVQFVGWSPG